MKKQFLILTVSLLLSMVTKAQEKHLSEAQKAQIQTQINAYLTDLDLSEDQIPEFKEITLKYGKEMIALRESSKNRFMKYKEFKSLNKNRNEEMSALLTAEQFKIYLEIQGDLHQKMKEHRKKKN